MKIFPHPLTLEPIRFIDRFGIKAALHEGDEILLATSIPSLHIHDAAGRANLFHDPHRDPPINTYLTLPKTWMKNATSRSALAEILAAAAGLVADKELRTKPSATRFLCVRPEDRPPHLWLRWDDTRSSARVGQGKSVLLNPEENSVGFLRAAAGTDGTYTYAPASFVQNGGVIGQACVLPPSLEVLGNELLLAQLFALVAGCEVVALDRALREKYGVYRYDFGAADQFAKHYKEPTPVLELRERTIHIN